MQRECDLYMEVFDLPYKRSLRIRYTITGLLRLALFVIFFVIILKPSNLPFSMEVSAVLLLTFFVFRRVYIVSKKPWIIYTGGNLFINWYFGNRKRVLLTDVSDYELKEDSLILTISHKKDLYINLHDGEKDSRDMLLSLLKELCL